MAAVTPKSELEKRVSRDQRNAEVAAGVANEELARLNGGLEPDGGIYVMNDHDRNRIDFGTRRRASLKAISSEPFQAMVEVYAEVVGDNGDVQGKQQLWYATPAP